MSTLWTYNGNLVVNGSGQPIFCDTCPCVVEEPPVNTCNSCDPAIPDTLYVTLSGLAGDFAAWNGKHTLEWVSGCLWRCTSPLIELRWYAPGPWYVIFGSTVDAGCTCCAAFCGSSSACVETGSYTHWDASACECRDSGCNDTDSCENSVGATCVVSLT